MDRLNFPANYSSIPETDQRAVCGGGELSEALGDFFNNLHIGNLFLGSAIIAVSFTFVPTMLINVIMAAYRFAQSTTDTAASLIGR